MANLGNWFPPESGVLDAGSPRCMQMPDGFKVVKEGEGKDKENKNPFVDCDTRDIGHQLYRGVPRGQGALAQDLRRWEAGLERGLGPE